MAETVDDISISYTEDDTVITRQLDKVVLTKGAWSTIVFKYQDWDRSKQEYGPVKFTIRRYQKRDGEYKQKSKFNISSIAQATKIIETLQKWIDE
ncbi:MAG TPA: hypothetical protein ENI65_07000 [Gammaproteobacteria bacterium]|nr:hypothetical protein [Gammaproteobacteria bacterium]